jgi:hypothetical protein
MASFLKESLISEICYKAISKGALAAVLLHSTRKWYPEAITKKPGPILPCCGTTFTSLLGISRKFDRMPGTSVIASFSIEPFMT